MSSGNESAGEVLIRIAEERLELFHCGDNAYGTTTKGQTLKLDSKPFKRWLSRQYYAEKETAAGDECMQRAISVLGAMALYEGSEHEVHVRLAGDDTAIYMDLGDAEYTVMKIHKGGWQPVSGRTEVRFIRPNGILSLPLPADMHPTKYNGAIERLRKFINCSDDDWVLLVGWLLAALRPSGPYPILLLTGEQGSAKSTTARLLRSIIDPNKAMLRAVPRSERDLAIAATNSHVQTLDNLSEVKPWLSDALCRVATGGAFAARTHYENDGETLFEFQKPIIITSITDVASRSDLLDRGIMVQLPRILDGDRRTEADLNKEFEEELPHILGGLLNAVCHGIRELPNTKLDEQPRMADAAHWVTACEHGLDWNIGRFNELYRLNRQQADQIALQSDRFAASLLQLLSGRSVWEGTPTALCDALAELVEDRDRQYMPGPQKVSGKLKRIAPNLRRMGVDVETGVRNKDQRLITIRSSGDANDANDDTEQTVLVDPGSRKKEIVI